MRFIKMHGIGNDYVYVNGFQEHVVDPPTLARQIADRHFGVGGDGLILVLPPDPGVNAHVRMRMFNADGSESEMCGNGVRCVCKFAHDHRIVPDIEKINPLLVQTGRGVLTLSYTLDSHGHVNRVTVDMGQPILTPRDIPVHLLNLDRVVNYNTAGLMPWNRPSAPRPQWATEAGLTDGMTCVSMGNPHAVFFCHNVLALDLAHTGPLIENHPLFPRRINVHFVQVHARDQATMRTWERGTGITLACGTGAAAVCVAGALTQRTERQLLIHLPGGDLNLEWRQSDDHVLMTGPATEVFKGEWK